MQTVTIASRFNGPDGSANGGYACGQVAAFLPGIATVRLRAKPPLDTPLTVVQTGAGVELHHEGSIVAQGRTGTFDDEPVPEAPTLEQATAAEAGYSGFCDHVFPRCFVCGPNRDEGDGLRLFTGPVEGRELVACSWKPSAAFETPEGTIDPQYVWAALDCPSFFGLRVPYDKVFLLGEMTGALLAPIPGQEPLIVYGWGRRIEGRKNYAGSAIATADGTVLAHAQHVWIEVRTA